MTHPAALAVSRALQDLAGELDTVLERIAGERVALTLFVWTPEFANYVASTKDRGQIIHVLEKFIAKWKAGMPDIPVHERQ